MAFFRHRRHLGVLLLVGMGLAVPRSAAAAWKSCSGLGWYEKVPVIWHGFTKERVVALTFDDGPDPRFTPAVLAVLHRYGVHATFFVVGKNVKRWPDLLRAEMAAGHEIGNHTYSHPELYRLPREKVEQEIVDGDAVVAEVAGVVPRFFRPPYERLSLAIFQAAWSTGKKIVLSGVCLEHHEVHTPQEMAARVLAQIRPGTIILAHDGRLDRKNTVAALPLLLAELKARGYRVVTLGELLGEQETRPLSPPRYPSVADQVPVSRAGESKKG